MSITEDKIYCLDQACNPGEAKIRKTFCLFVFSKSRGGEFRQISKGEGIEVFSI